MTLSEFRYVLDILKNLSFQKLHINGGEPLVHKEFREMTLCAKERFPEKILVLGTNLVLLEGREDIIRFVRKHYNEVLIGCDDEHNNIDALERVIPLLKQNEDLVVVINSLVEYTCEDVFKRIDRLKEQFGIIAVRNYVYHNRTGPAVNNLKKGLCAKQNTVILIQENGDFYRCFNCAVPDDREGNVFDPTFLDLVNSPRKNHFLYCPWCKCYE